MWTFVDRLNLVLRGPLPCFRRLATPRIDLAVENAIGGPLLSLICAGRQIWYMRLVADVVDYMYFYFTLGGR